MARLTINLDDRTHRALEEAAARQKRSMDAIIEESLEMRGIQPFGAAKEIAAKGRAKSGLGTEEAMALAVEETRRFRRGE